MSEQMEEDWQETRERESAARQAWLDQLKPGDPVYYRSGWMAQYDETTVTRRTKARWIVIRPPGAAGNEYVFNADGRLRGELRIRLEQPTQEIRDAIRKAEVVREIDRVDWLLLTLPALETIMTAIEQDRKVEA